MPVTDQSDPMASVYRSAKKKHLQTFARRRRAGAAHPGGVKTFSKRPSIRPFQKQTGPRPATQPPTHADSFPFQSEQSIPSLPASASKIPPESLKPVVDCHVFFEQPLDTSLPFVSTAGRGAVPSGTAPAFYGGNNPGSAPSPALFS